MIPGSNLLNLALTVIGHQFFDWYKFKARTTNAAGLDVPTYQPPISLQGSIQPVPRNLYAAYGLQLEKNYFTFFVSQDILDIRRDVSGDQMFFNGKVYQCVSITDWFPMDGWTPVLCVQVPDVG